MRFIAAFSLLLASLFFSAPAEARIHKGGAAVPLQGPILQPTALNVANLTRNGKGGERLSTMHFTTMSVTPVTFGGVDLLTGLGTSPVSWTEACVGGTVRTCADWTVPAANVAEGGSAITPVPSSGGQGNLAGDYTFNVTAKDSGGNSSNTVVLTIHTVNPTGGGCISVGDNDALFAVAPSGFGTSANQCVLLATGFNVMSGRYIFNIPLSNTNNVIMTSADLTRPAAFSNVQVSSMSLFEWDDLTLSGDVPSAAVCMVCAGTSGGGYSSMKFVRVHGYYSPTEIGSNSGLLVYQAAGCISGCSMTNSEIDYLWSGFVTGGNETIDGVVFRHYSNNCRFITNTAAIHIWHSACISPDELADEHGDCMQYADAAGPQNVDLKDDMCITADGTSTSQGQYFGGTAMSGAAYIDNGTPGVAGKILHFPGGFPSNAANGAQIISPGNIAASDNYVIASGATETGTTATLNIPTNVLMGSSGSPIQIYVYGNLNFNAQSIIYAGPTFKGMFSAYENGTSVEKYFAYVKQNNANIASTTSGPTFIEANCDVPNLHNGTWTVSEGFLTDGVGTQSGPFYPAACPSNALPANMTVAGSVVQAGCAATPMSCPAAVAAFKNGNPEVTLEAIPNSGGWDGDSAHVMGKVAQSLIPKAGSGFLGPVMDNGSGQCAWRYDGVVIPNCTP